MARGGSGGAVGCIGEAASLPTCTPGFPDDPGADFHLDSAFIIFVDGNGYRRTTGTSERLINRTAGAPNSRELVFETQRLAEVDVSVEFRSFGPVLRQFVNVTNPGPTGTNAEIQWTNNVQGQDSGLTYATSDGDPDVETTDSYVVVSTTQSSRAEGGRRVQADAATGFVFQGFGGRAPESVGAEDGSNGSPIFGGPGDDGFNAVYDLSIPAGETASLLFFAIFESRDLCADWSARALRCEDRPGDQPGRRPTLPPGGRVATDQAIEPA